MWLARGLLRLHRPPEAIVGGLPDGAVDQRQRRALGDLVLVDDDGPADVLIDDAERAGDGGRAESNGQVAFRKTQPLGEYGDEPPFHLAVNNQVRRADAS